MNSDFARWLLDVDRIPRNAESLRMAWERQWPTWLWAILLLSLAGLAAWSYWRLAGPRAGRAILAAARFGMLALVLIVIGGPMLELPRVTVEEDWVLMLVDRSESMTIADVGAENGGVASRRTRDDQLRGILNDNADTWEALDADRQVVWLGFHDGTFNLAENPQGGKGMAINLDAPEGQRTRLAVAIEQALQRAAARALSGIIVFSDGRTTDPPSRALVRRLRSSGVQVYTVPLGSQEPLGDLAIRQVDAPRRAFVRDKVPVTVGLDELGAIGSQGDITISLIDETTGEVLDHIELAPGEPRDYVTLTAQPTMAGETTWRVVVETSRLDLIPDNNLKTFLIELIDRPLRVLYIEGYPRWDYRYLKNLLVREKSIESSVMLLSADRDFAQEGNLPITRVPRSPEEFAQFDVIVLGDVPGSFFSPDQLDMIRSHVADRGAGLLWIGGERNTPSTYGVTALADLLPMRGALTLPVIGVPVNMRPTQLADRLGVLRLGTDAAADWPDDLADPAYGWSQLHWAQRIEPGRLKPTAEVLATTAKEFQGAPLPLLTHMRYGAGQTIYVATDEIWRWRYGRGEMYPERFWVQLIRMLGRESLVGASQQATLQVTPRRLTTAQVMRIELDLMDARLADDSRQSVAVVLETTEGRTVAELELHRTDENRQRFAATYRPDVLGSLRVRVDDPTLPDAEELVVAVEVYSPDDELRRPETDHPGLATLAGETAGQTLSATDLSRLPDLLPDRSVRTENPLTERIWDTPLFFALIFLALTGEWIGRKVVRLA